MCFALENVSVTCFLSQFVLFPVVRFNSEFHLQVIAFDTGKNNNNNNNNKKQKSKTKPNNSFNELTYRPTNPSVLGTRLFVKVDKLIYQHCYYTGACTKRGPLAGACTKRGPLAGACAKRGPLAGASAKRGPHASNAHHPMQVKLSTLGKVGSTT